MTTTDTVVDRALLLASSDMDTEEAISDLEDCCGGRRVAVVMARQRLLEQDEQPGGTNRAVELLDGLLVRLGDV